MLGEITSRDGQPVRLAIADPPYLGRAGLWYGGKGRSKQGTAGRAAGRGCLAREYHPDAHEWDDPAKHIALMVTMRDEYDGWVMACSGKTLAPLLGVAATLGARLAIWHVTGTGHRVPDLLSAPHPVSGFVGAKPDQWTRWVLDLMGYQPGDEVDDLFPGSGAVTRAMGVLL